MIERRHELLDVLSTWITMRRLVSSRVQIGAGAMFIGLPSISIVEGSNLCIGRNLRAVSSERAQVIGVNHRCIIRTMAGGSITIGDDFGFSGGAIVALGSVTIGNGCLFGANVLVADTDFHPVDSLKRRYEPLPPGNDANNIRIGDNVFVGTDAKILKGVTIGNNSVVAAGAVVTSSVPSNTIVAGVPAKVVSAIDFRPSGVNDVDR